MRKGFVVYTRKVQKYTNVEIVPFEIPNLLFDSECFEKMILKSLKKYEAVKDVAVPAKLSNTENNNRLSVEIQDYNSGLTLHRKVKFLKFREDNFRIEVTRNFQKGEINITFNIRDDKALEKGLKGIKIFRNGEFIKELKISELDARKYNENGTCFLEFPILNFETKDEISFEIGW